MTINESLYDLKYRIKSRVGNGISGRVTFEASCSNKLHDNDLADIQCRLGYHPNGYGMFNVKDITDTNVIYTYIWQCSTSCD